MAAFVYLVTFSAVAHIVCDYRKVDHPEKAIWRFGTYLFKPLTMLLIIAMLMLANIGDAGNWVLAALLFSLIGDVFLMLPKKPIAPALGSFLVAHVLFVIEFSERAPLQWSWSLGLAAAIIVVWASWVSRRLMSNLGRLLIPGLIYFSAISLMVFYAANVFLAGVSGGGLLLAGALLFFSSDTALAFNRFGKPWRSAQLVILSTYFSGQFLITASIL